MANREMPAGVSAYDHRKGSVHRGDNGPGSSKQKRQSYQSHKSLADDIHRLADLLSPQAMPAEELSDTTQALITRVALTLQKENNCLLFLDEPTISTLISSLQILLDGTNGPVHHEYIAGHRHILRRLLVKICRDTGILPSSLFLSDIVCSTLHNVAGGSFSDIYRAEHGGEQVALKRLRVFESDPEHRASQFKAFCREALVWRQLRHAHILSFLGIDTKTFEPSGLHCMVSPWMDNGSIADCMARREGGRMDRWVLDRWVCEIADGLDYLHSERVVHGDLRGANILVDDRLSIKLSDFGLSKFADASTASWGSHGGGALRWMAPEVLSGVQATLESDVYSFGCVCSELYTARRPFAHITTDAHVVVQIMKGARPDIPASLNGPFGDVLRPLMITCWNGTPATRPTAGVLVGALRPFVVKDEFDMEESGMGKVSYLRGSVSAVGHGSDAVVKMQSKPLMTSSVFRPLQPQSLPPLVIPSTNAPTKTYSHYTSSSNNNNANNPPSGDTGVFLQPDWQRSPLVLVIDNTGAFQGSARKVLEDYGCIVEWAQDGAQAMAMCDWSRPIFDLVFMRLNGASATYLIRDYDKEIPIIALSTGGSSKSEGVMRNHYHLVGMNDVLPASPSSARLLGTVEKYLFHLRTPPPPSVPINQEPDADAAHHHHHRHPHAYRKRQVSVSSEVPSSVGVTLKRSRAF